MLSGDILNRRPSHRLRKHLPCLQIRLVRWSVDRDLEITFGKVLTVKIRRFGLIVITSESRTIKPDILSVRASRPFGRMPRAIATQHDPYRVLVRHRDRKHHRVKIVVNAALATVARSATLAKRGDRVQFAAVNVRAWAS